MFKKKFESRCGFRAFVWRYFRKIQSAKAQKSQETDDGGALSMRRSPRGINITTWAGHSLSKPEPSIYFHVWMF